jgi:cation transport regulator ChaC
MDDPLSQHAAPMLLSALDNYVDDLCADSPKNPAKATDYIFGYGSIINNASRRATLEAALSSLHDNINAPSQEDAVIAHLSPKFGFIRSWCFRSATGFTALGLQLRGSANESVSEEVDICGVLFPVPSANALSAFDIREVGYFRKEVPAEYVTVAADIGPECHKVMASTLKNKMYAVRIWTYVPEPSRSATPDEEYPIIQTYVDVCIRGCLQWGGIDLAKQFVLSTHGWNEFFLNDAPTSRRPWLHRPDYTEIDGILEELTDHVKFSERRHPEEYASRHLMTAQGIWNVPSRNSLFICREAYLESVQAALLTARSTEEASAATAIRQIQLAGIGKNRTGMVYCS